MKHFIFYCRGMSNSSMRSHLDLSWKSLPAKFTLADVKQGMFSQSINKRLLAAKKHGTKIIVRRYYGLPIVIKLIDKDDLKADADKRKISIRNLKKKLKLLSKSNDIAIYLRYLAKFGKASRDYSLLSACACINVVRKKL